MEPFRTVLFPTDFSEYSEAAFHVACSLAAHYGAKLAIVHVQEPPLAAGELVMPLLSDEEAEGKQRQEMLHAVQPSNPSFPVEHHLFYGYAADEILQASEKLGADVIVMGTHGRSGLSRALMGSIAAAVVRSAHCPVLTIKLPRTGTRTRKSRQKQAAK